MIDFKQFIFEEYIVNVNQKGPMIYVYSKSGLITTIATSGKLIGFTPENINVKCDGFIYIYNDQGAIINMIPESIY